MQRPNLPMHVRRTQLAAISVFHLLHKVALFWTGPIVLTRAFWSRWGQRTFEIEFWDFYLQFFLSDSEKTAPNLEKVKQTSVKQMVQKFWFICLC